MKKIFKIWNKKNNCYDGSYSRAYHDQYEFPSEEDALDHNCHGMFHDTDTYEIHEIQQTDTVISKLPPKQEYLETTKKSRESKEKFEKFKKEHPGLNDFQAILTMHTPLITGLFDKNKKEKK